MAAAIHNFFIEQGTSFEIIFEYLNDNGSPITISSNDCVRLRMKDDRNEYRAWRNASSDTGAVLTRVNDASLAANQIKFQLPATVTKTFLFNTANYALDLVINSIESNTIKLATGQISVIKDLFLTECQDGTVSSDFKTCIPCNSISAADAAGTQTNIQPTPAVSAVGPDVTPTPSASFGSTPTPTPSSPVSVQEDLCDYLCRGLDIFSELYTGSGLYISDALITSGVNIPVATSGNITIANTGIAKNIELYIDNLVHDNPSDLTMILTPPSGDAILLSHRNKINNYVKQSGIKFAFSNKAIPGTYLTNKSNSNDLYVNVLKNTGICLPSPYNLTYKYSFDHLFDAGNGSVSGNWNLCFIDHDSGGSGYIGGWNLIVTYAPPTYTDGE